MTSLITKLVTIFCVNFQNSVEASLKCASGCDMWLQISIVNFVISFYASKCSENLSLV